MNFSEPIRLSNGLAQISPNAFYVASVAQHKVTVRLCTSLQVFQLYSCIDVVHTFSWSPDSSFILCVLKKRGIVQVLSLENPEWTCKIDEGSAGLLSAEWAPDSRHFLTVTDFYLRITIWSLSEVAVSYLKYAKPCTNNLAFAPGGRYLALIERREFRDHLSLFDCHSNWELLRNIQLDTQDAVGLRWSPDGRFLAVWDDCLRYRMTVYTVDGRHLHSYCAYEPEQDLLGVKAVCWSPSGQLLAIGSYDQKCRLLNSFNWSCLVTLAHPTDKPINAALGLSATGKPIQVDGELDSVSPDAQETALGYRPHRIDIYQEQHVNPSAFDAEFRRPQSTEVVYRLAEEAVTIASTKPDPKLPNPKIGVGLASFSKDGRFLATRNDNAPRALWIWSIDRRLSLFSLLLHSNPVQCLAWDPTNPARLALCTGSDSVFMWTPQGCLVVQTPSHFKFAINTVVWCPRGDSLLLLSDSQFCLCYLDGTESAEQHCKGRGQVPVWEPPRRPTSDLPFHTISTLDHEDGASVPSLPLGVFGLSPEEAGEEDGAITNQVELHVGDTPNWLRRRVAKGPVKDPNRRRPLSTDVLPRPQPNRAVTSVSSRRQAWAPPHENPLGSSGRRSAEEQS